MRITSPPPHPNQKKNTTTHTHPQKREKKIPGRQFLVKVVISNVCISITIVVGLSLLILFLILFSDPYYHLLVVKYNESTLLFSVFLVQALFWQQQNYYGVDLTPLYGSAFQGYFSQVQKPCVFISAFLICCI